jgi:hypothetical protein
MKSAESIKSLALISLKAREEGTQVAGHESVGKATGWSSPASSGRIGAHKTLETQVMQDES